MIKIKKHKEEQTMLEVIKTKSPAAIGPYSQAIKSGNLVFVSGQIPMDQIRVKSKWNN